MSNSPTQTSGALGLHFGGDHFHHQFQPLQIFSRPRNLPTDSADSIRPGLGAYLPGRAALALQEAPATGPAPAGAELASNPRIRAARDARGIEDASRAIESNAMQVAWRVQQKASWNQDCGILVSPATNSYDPKDASFAKLSAQLFPHCYPTPDGHSTLTFEATLRTRRVC